MKKKIFILGFLMLTSIVLVRGQVGINLESPNATLDVQPQSKDGTTAEGIIAPKLTLAELTLKNTKYTDSQTGAIVYITDVTGTPSGITANVTSVGYYYFDGQVWQSIGGKITLPTEPWLVQGSTTEATSNTQKIFQTGNVAIGTGTPVVGDTSKLYVSGYTKITKGITIGTDSTDNSVINGNLNLKDLIVVPNAKSLVVDRQSGKVGFSEYVPKDILYIQKRSGQLLDLAGSGAAERAVVWSNSPDVVTLSGDPVYDFAADGEYSDLMTNNLNIDINYEDGEFTFIDVDPTETDVEKKKVLVEVSGYVNLTTGGGNAINLLIQIKRNGSAEWKIIAGSRTLVSNSYTTSVVVSPAAAYVYPGDVVRLAVGRPSSSSAWGTARIDRPYGLKYLAALKIAAI